MPDYLISLGNAAVLNLRQRAVYYRKLKVSLTTIEFSLIRILAGRFRVPVSRDEISVGLYGSEWDGLNRAVDVNVARLRRKLKNKTQNYLEIRPVRNIGYYLIENPTAEAPTTVRLAAALSQAG